VRLVYYKETEKQISEFSFKPGIETFFLFWIVLDGPPDFAQDWFQKWIKILHFYFQSYHIFHDNAFHPIIPIAIRFGPSIFCMALSKEENDQQWAIVLI